MKAKSMGRLTFAKMGSLGHNILQK